MASLQSIGYRYLCKHNSGRNKDIFPLWNPNVQRPSSVRSLDSGPSLLAVALAQCLACLFTNPQGCCQGSSAWP